ncbi:MAG: hypothetical protein PHX13_08700 [Thiovulaceae bacterium]|nr:hypothetical protein [Sulfurimonadaceae bacterium]
MGNGWQEVFSTNVDGRNVIGELYEENDYRVKTTQKNDDNGYISENESSKTYMPPRAAGSLITIEGQTLDELKDNLMSEGEFSSDDAQTIVDKFISAN